MRKEEEKIPFGKQLGRLVIFHEFSLIFHSFFQQRIAEMNNGITLATINSFFIPARNACPLFTVTPDTILINLLYS